MTPPTFSSFSLYDPTPLTVVLETIKIKALEALP